MTDNFTTLTKRLDSLNARFDAMVARKDSSDTEQRRRAKEEFDRLKRELNDPNAPRPTKAAAMKNMERMKVLSEHWGFKDDAAEAREDADSPEVHKIAADLMAKAIKGREKIPEAEARKLYDQMLIAARNVVKAQTGK